MPDTTITNEQLVAEYQQTHNRAFINLLWEQNKGYINYCASRFYKSHDCRCDFADLTQQGFFAIPLTAKHFDPSKGGSFLTLLTYYLLNQFESAAMLRTKKQLHESSCISLYTPKYSKEGAENGYLIDDLTSSEETDIERAEERICNQQLRTALKQLTKSLQPRRAKFVLDYYLNGKSVQDIANERGCNKNYIYTELRYALDDLRKKARRKEFWTLVEAYVDGYTNGYNQSAEKVVIRRQELRSRAFDEVKELMEY